MNRLFQCLVFWMASATAMAQDSPAREHLERFASELDSLTATFSQVVISGDGQVMDEGEGQLWLRQPGHFRWEYAGEFPETIVADGERIWLYDESLEQVTVREQSGATADSPLSILTRPQDLDQQFNVADLGQDQGLYLLELTSRDSDTEFDRVILGLDEQGIRLMAMEDAFGMRTEIRLRDVQRNPQLEDSLFAFEPPPGTDVMGELEP